MPPLDGEPLAAIIALNVQAELTRRGWTLEKLAEATGLPQIADEAYWKSGTSILVEEVFVIACALSVRASMLVKDNRCPDWCTLPARHDAEEPSRIHYAPVPSKAFVSMNDNPTYAKEPAWYAEVPGVDLSYDTASMLAAELRIHAADIIAAAEWLEALQ